MERKAEPKPPKHKPTYLKAWRRKRGYTQAKFIERLNELLGDIPDDEPHLKVPRTTASLSRIENGEQPYNQAAIEAYAAVLDIEPDCLIGRDPTKEGKVISMIDRATPTQLRQIEAVVEAIMNTGTNG